MHVMIMIMIILRACTQIYNIYTENYTTSIYTAIMLDIKIKK